MFNLWEYLVIKFILIILNIYEYLIKFGRRKRMFFVGDLLKGYVFLDEDFCYRWKLLFYFCKERVNISVLG